MLESQSSQFAFLRIRFWSFLRNGFRQDLLDRLTNTRPSQHVNRIHPSCGPMMSHVSFSQIDSTDATDCCGVLFTGLSTMTTYDNQWTYRIISWCVLLRVWTCHKVSFDSTAMIARLCVFLLFLSLHLNPISLHLNPIIPIYLSLQS